MSAFSAGLASALNVTPYLAPSLSAPHDAPSAAHLPTLPFGLSPALSPADDPAAVAAARTPSDHIREPGDREPAVTGRTSLPKSAAPPPQTVKEQEPPPPSGAGAAPPGSIGVFTTPESLTAFPVAATLVTIVWKVLARVFPAWGGGELVALMIAFVIGLVIFLHSQPNGLRPKDKFVAATVALLNSFALAATALGINTVVT